MPTITVKNIPSDLYEHLKQSAKDNRRSINSEIIVCIERAVRSRSADSEAPVARGQQLREQTTGYLIDTDELAADGVDITHHGRVIGRVVSANSAPIAQDLARVWADLDQLAAEIGARWPAHLSAADAVSEQRRNL